MIRKVIIPSILVLALIIGGADEAAHENETKRLAVPSCHGMAICCNTQIWK